MHDVMHDVMRARLALGRSRAVAALRVCKHPMLLPLSVVLIVSSGPPRNVLPVQSH